MQIILIEQIRSDQIMLVRDELTDLFYIVVESIQNYTFSPHFVSKSYKTKKAAMSNFNKMSAKYKGI